jgi:hypothetical protein
MADVAIIDGRAFTREQWNNRAAAAIHRGGYTAQSHWARFNPVQATPPPAPTPPPPTPQAPQPFTPTAGPAPSVATASTVNEVRESAKKREGFQSTLLSKGQGPKKSRARSKAKESQFRKTKTSLGETTKKTLLGSAS